LSVHGGFQLAAVILAAGESRRFGSAKALLQWENDNFVNTLVRKANLAGYFPVITVLGANHSQILETLPRDCGCD
jgi:CTP:molybdopterin cytidylyltransferase MocA